jgi:hypothetical protein
MTQLATPESVFGDYDDTVVTTPDDGRKYHLTSEDGRFYVRVYEPESGPTAGLIHDLPIVMCTGSHHMQVYWFSIGESRALGQLPIVFLKEQDRWVPRRSAFLQDVRFSHNAVVAGVGSEVGRWNHTCLNCHATYGRSRMKVSEVSEAKDSTFDTRVAEFGISCEACHGPGESHVQLHRNRDSQQHDSDDPIVNPAKLSSRRSAQVCGRCHSIQFSDSTFADTAELNSSGHPYRPGDDLEEVWVVSRYNDKHRMLFGRSPRGKIDDFDEFMLDSFWSDGMVRVSGREYNGLIESRCFNEGEMSCLSCHELHPDPAEGRNLKEWANDQLRTGMDGDQSCIQCHAAESFATSEHTHHASASSGSRCMNCHMPYTTYGLLKTIRSHEIDSPDATVSLETGRAAACNLCHLDRTLDWTAQHLTDWYGMERMPVEDDHRMVSEIVWQSLAGDAAQRAIAASALGRKAALDVSGTNWVAPFLCTLLEDPYDAVRFIAHKSLLQLPGFEDAQFDYVASTEEREQAISRIREHWSKTVEPRPSNTVLIDADGRLNVESFERLLKKRNNRPVSLQE